MHRHRHRNHEDGNVDERMVETRHESQHIDQSCRLQTLTLSCVNGVEEDHYNCVKQEHVRQVVQSSRKSIVNHNTKQTQRDVVVDTDVCVAQEEGKTHSKNTKQHCCHNEHQHLPLDVDDFSAILTILILSFLVQVVELEGELVDCTAHGNLLQASSVEIKFCVDSV